MSLLAGQTITIGYYQATYNGNGGVGAVVFNGRASSDATGNDLANANANLADDSEPTVYFISSDGVGMVTSTGGDTNAPNGGTTAHNNTRQPIIDSAAAGSEATINFYYSLDANQYIKSGELELMLPSDWSSAVLLPIPGLMSPSLGLLFTPFSDNSGITGCTGDLQVGV